MAQRWVQTASEEGELLEDEMRQGVYVASTTDFLQAFLRLPDDDKTVERFELRHGKAYFATFGVLNHPDDDDDNDAENSEARAALYSTFVDAANAILGCCCDGNVHSYWVCRPESAPKSNDDSTAHIRPDAAAVLGDQRAYFRALEWLEQSEAIQMNDVIVSVLSYAEKHIEHFSETGEDVKGRIAQLKNLNGSGSSSESISNAVIELLEGLRNENSPAINSADPDHLVTRMRQAIKMLHNTLPIPVINQHCEGKLQRVGATECDADVNNNLLIRLEELSTLWWLRVTTPVEVRLTDSGDDQREGSVQLCRYMRQVLRAQPDRRYVFGLLLCDHKLLVLYCDRSGLMASMDWIDIRASPEQFIQVVVGLSTLDPEKLGWDKTMLLRLQTQNDKLVFAPSTDPRVKLEDYGSSVHDTQWAIFVPNSHSSDEGKWYATVRAISLSTAEVMVGRATSVWLVKELTDNKESVVPSAGRLVLKSGWGRVGITTEKEFHGDERLDHVGHILSSVTVGHPTFANIGVEGESLRGRLQTARRSWRAGFCDSDIVPVLRQLTFYMTTRDRKLKMEEHLTPRILTRTLMQTYGWPIEHFKDLEELLTVARDAVRGHRNLYFKNRVLQSDISINNMLVCPDDDEAGHTHGELIDLDYAKQAPGRLRYSKPSSLERFAGLVQMFVEEELQIEIGPLNPTFLATLMRRSQYCCSKIPTQLIKVYVGSPELMVNAVPNDQSDAEAIWSRIQDEMQLAFAHPTESCYEKWLLDPASRPPFWLDRSLRDTFDTKTGTVKFMSAELVEGNPWRTAYILGTASQRTDLSFGGPVHTAIHDMESVFWVVLYICLSRRGPGGARREETQWPTLETPHAGRVRRIIEALFDSPLETTVARNKRNLFENHKDFEVDVLPFIHPYFKPLETLLLRWFKLFQIAYRTYDDVGQGIIHDQVLDVLNDALKALPKQTDPEYDLMTKAELERRQRDLDQYANFSREPHTLSSSPVHNTTQSLVVRNSPHGTPAPLSTKRVAPVVEKSTPTAKPAKRLKIDPQVLSAVEDDGYPLWDTSPRRTRIMLWEL
ncbi:hypothetical protein BXZ70DRAFT_955687 [Cristinia sonorae]|uniref:Fungal-type protein kinase domain-containing protein n=1 Tax=Cristinia sonorae TaxID=1940300 RepID=A0A8K0XL65_9AGAR|nr:hypothetical protein BXZ70DRAFT_955687 [Cristinia sonorae]